MKRSAAVLAVLILAALAGAAWTPAAEQDHVRIMAQAWYPKLTGDGVYQGGRFDVEDDLDASNDDWHFGLDAAVRLGRHRIFANYSDGDHDGDKTPVSVDLTRGHALYGYSFVNMKYFDLGVVGGVGTYDLTTKGTGEKLSLNATDLTVGIDLGVRMPVFPLSIRGQALYVPTEISGDDTTLTDAAVSFDFHVLVLNFQVGYRYYDLESKNTDDRNRESYKFQGPFAGIGVSF